MYSHNRCIGYWKDGYQVLVLPAFDIVPNYPFPKFWQRQYWRILRYVRKYNPDIIQTHTRFFLSTLLGGLLATLWRKTWVHVEHGSGFVKGLSWFKRIFADTYDHTL
ncbi:MAG: glycosyltransferase [bacterium]